MGMNIQPGEIGHIIQLSIAPVFLLTGVGTNMLVLTNRLARIIDRTRALEEKLQAGTHKDRLQFRQAVMGELDVLFSRARKINRAIFLSTSCALLICLVVAILFVADAMDLKLVTPIASLFVLAMVSLTGSFIYLLREVLQATDFQDKQRQSVVLGDPS